MDTRTISICSGYGGIELGLSAVVPGIRTVCYVENEVSVCEILGARIKDGLLDDAPIWTDLRTFDATAWRGRVHLITGGFPCQPHSVAGNRKGADDSRELSGEVLRIAEELGYPTLFLENVPGIRKFWYYNVRPRLQSMGYRVEEVLVTAAETGAPHKRQRLFILAHHEKFGHGGWNSFWGGTEQRVIQPQEQRGDKMGGQTEGCSGSLAHNISEGLQGEHGNHGVSEWTVHTDVELNGNGIRGRTGRGSSDVGNSHAGLDHDEGEALRTGRDSTDTASLKVGDSQSIIGERPVAVGTGTGKPEEKTGNTGGAVADTAEQGLQGIRTEGSVNVNPGRNTLPLYPPGPDDTRGWESVYSEVPSLIPTFCRVAYGPTPWLDQRLRAIGNGVVPAVAARAWQILSRRFLDE